MLGLALAGEVELHVVEGVADFLERGLRIEVGIARGEQGADITQTPPLALLIIIGAAERLANHLHQIVQMLIRLVFLNQRGNLIVIQPEALTLIKEVKCLGKKLPMIKIVLEIDITRHTDTDETTRTRGVDKRFSACLLIHF